MNDIHAEAIALIEELRNKKSRDNRQLYDRAADMIEYLCNAIFSPRVKRNFDVRDELMAKMTEQLRTTPGTILAVRDDGVCIDTSDFCICCGGSGKFKAMQAARQINGPTVRAEDLMITCPVCFGTGRRSDNK